MTNEIGFLGAGEQASEAEEFLFDRSVVFRAVNLPAAQGPGSRLIDITTTDPRYTTLPVTAAVGAPGLRVRLIEQWNGNDFHTIVALGASVSRSATIGEGSIIGPGAVITAGARLGRHVLVNVGASISHASVLGDFVTVSPGARIAGNCTIGDGVFVGIGAVVSNGVAIAAGTVVGAGAVVVDDIGTAGVYVGVPARRLRDTNEWLQKL